MKTDNMTEEQRADYCKEGVEKEHATGMLFPAESIQSKLMMKMKFSLSGTECFTVRALKNFFRFHGSKRKSGHSRRC